MNKWNWEIIDGETYIVCNGKKIAKMLTNDFTIEEMSVNASLIKVLVNNHLEKI